MAEKTVRSVNPADESVIEEFEPFTPDRIETALDGSEQCFQHWRHLSFHQRSERMLAAADVLDANRDRYARDMTREMGKPLAQARAEIDKCAWVCRHYAEHAESYLRDEPLESGGRQAYVRHLPLGPVLAVMPWNFPFWQVFRFAAPTLMAGNTGLLKHASNVWRSALNIEEVFREAGFPEGCFRTLLVGSGPVGDMIADRRVRAVTLTGSGPAGRAVAAAAGKALKPSLLELGGSDAFIIMPSADLSAALETAVKARTQNTGQSCIAAKRFFVHADIFDAFENGLRQHFSALTLGDPMDVHTEIGPLATAGIRNELAGQVSASVRGGARLFESGHALPEKGFWFDPVILTGAPDDTPSARDELFGPAANLWKVDSLDDAIARANANSFGLGSVIFTKDEDEMARAVTHLDAGATFINAMVASDPRLPFGGIKDSGYGRELSADGIRAFMNRKTVYLA